MIRLYRDIRELIAQANQIAAQSPGDSPRWSLFLTNRSFIALALAIILNVAVLLGVPLPAFVGPALADHIVEAVTVLLGLWAAVERAFGWTRVVWSRRQAVKAVEEAVALNSAPQAVGKADALAEALKEAGARGTP